MAVAKLARREAPIEFAHRGAFWFGVASVTGGVALHIPMFEHARHMHYMLRSMRMDTSMVAGMALIVVGLAATAYGLLPDRSALAAPRSRLRVQPLDDAPMRPAHIALLVVMAVAVTIDVMKPTTLSFVLPGVAKEYHLKSALHPHALPAALLPLSGIGGTVVGSLLWGWLGDRVGRRATILLAGVMFIGTSICGAMPSFNWNLAMCFIMGLAAGGMLPIAFALLAEVMPTRHRSWLMVLIGGDVAGAYVITSLLASWLEPHYGWRILWLVGAPTGLLLIALNHFIPESPRFLMARGRTAEAHDVMERFGVTVEASEGSGSGAGGAGAAGAAGAAGPAGPAGPGPVGAGVASVFSDLWRRPFTGLTTGVALFGLAYGLVTYGFVLWLPTNLRGLGLGVGTSDRLLADSALIGLPATVVVALLYGFWSAKKTMLGVATLTSATLLAFALIGNGVVHHRHLLELLIVVLLVGSSSVIAVLTPYSSEVYPTLVRARGTGLAAGASKAGGLLGLSLAAGAVAPPGLVEAAIIGAVPAALSVAAIARYGIETRGRALEEISEQEHAPPALV